jgi:hopanoid biosynthesis associated protein HpnK
MVTGAECEDAVRLARENPRLAVGLHLVVISGRAALAPSSIPHLVDGSGRFSDDPVRAGLRYQFRPAAREELRREIREQLVRFRATGLSLSHVDGHLHMHAHPAVLSILVELAPEFEIPAVRLPADDPRLAAASPGPIRRLQSAIFALLRRSGESRLERAGVAVADRVYGLLATGHVTEEQILRWIEGTESDRVEIYCHPALELDGEPRNGPAGSGPRELAALLSPRVRRAVEERGFRLASPRERAGGSRAALRTDAPARAGAAS